MGHGLEIPERFKLAPGIHVQPNIPAFSPEVAAEGCQTPHELFAVLSMRDIATFSIEVEHKGGPGALGTKAWNALWHFHLLSVACGSPAFPLFTVSEGTNFTEFGVSNRNLIVNPVEQLKAVTVQQLAWARRSRSRFDRLVRDARFGVAIRYFGNSHYLFDMESRVMLLWAGIEALLEVEAEQSRRIALYCALMFDSDVAAKARQYERVKKAYGVRSRVVHGKRLTQAARRESYSTGSEILVRLLAKAVDLGRVPTQKELDSLATSGKLK
ncbi:MAG TPA: hypothetical protein VMN38_12275 [Sphingomicrobium sp.]|nr:hypothetical protein [Sphingomicrobium sp.]